jgi:hypothetical protein
METPLDLYGASREKLIRLVVQQRERLVVQEREIAGLRAELAVQREALAAVQARVGALLAGQEPPEGDAGAAHPTTMPGLKPTGRRRPSPEPRPRQRRAHGYGRKRMAPTARQRHAFAACPRCAMALSGGTVKRTREVIEVVPGRVEVTEHVYVERRCPRCHGRWQPRPDLGGVVVGQGRLGVGLLSLIAVLREELRLPVERIKWYLDAVHGLHLSVGAIVGTLHTVAERAAPLVAQLQETMRASPVLHADETGWRQAGRNGYAWTFSTGTARAFTWGGRDKAMLERAIGDAYGGVLVSDFYGVYTSYDGRHQFCWAHLLRDVDELAGQHAGDATVRGWADAVHGLYQRATAAAADPACDPRQRRQQRQAYEAELGALGAPFVGVADAPQRVLCERITKHLSELFVFVEDPAVPPTNNAAERSLRHLVTARKISGGTRSAAGTTTKMTLASLFGTWRLQDRDPLIECRTLLGQSQL